jgi:2-polyprenyl-6-methoxyphenol hydroxylase-like FAD-dependent oxidoreductase
MFGYLTIVAVVLVILWIYKNRNASDPNKVVGEHAVVLGGSLAGLFTVGLLAKRFKKITLIERDQFPQNAENRPGTPQGGLFHILLRKGLDLIDSIFPGIEKEMIASGAVEMDMGEKGRWYHKGGYRTQCTTGFNVLWFTRLRLEHLVRQRVAKIPNVTVMDGTTVTALIASEDGKRVIGVEYRKKSPQKTEEGDEELRCDLVVDCSGRGSKVKTWLKEEFDIDLQQSIINSRLGYSSGLVEVKEKLSYDWLYVTPLPPQNYRGFVAGPTEVPNQYMVCWAGYAGDHPPAEWEPLKEFSKSLPTEDTVEFMNLAKPIGTMTTYKRTENRRYFPEQIKNWPAGLLMIGDALCCFNPIYGQGMSASALEATVLDKILGSSQPNKLDDVPKRYFQEVKPIVDEFWLLASMEDYRCENIVADPCPSYLRWLHSYFDLILSMQAHNKKAFKDFCYVFHMRKSALLFFTPPYLWMAFQEFLRSKHRKQV